jgi:hypothetical protein
MCALTGEHVRAIPLDGSPLKVAANKTMIAVCQCWPKEEVIVMDTVTAQVLQRVVIMSSKFAVSGMALSAEGACAIATIEGCSVFVLGGTIGGGDSVTCTLSEPKLLIKDGVYPRFESVCFTGCGNIVTCDRKEVFVFAPDGVLVHRFKHGGGTPSVRVACGMGRVYVWDKCYVYVFD